MTYLIDTDWVVDFLSGQETAHDLIARLIPDGIAISIVTFIEVFEGIEGGRDPRDAERVFRQLLVAADVIGIGRRAARRTAQIRLELRRQGRAVNHRAFDLVIAATAMEHDLVLVTRNARHFEDIQGLRLYS